MSQDPILDYWNERSALQARAGSDDFIAKELEIAALSKHLGDGMEVAEFGCGNGITALELARCHNIKLQGFDFSPPMVEAARQSAQAEDPGGRVRFEVADVRDEPPLAADFDAVYTERMIINLPDWETQARAIRYLTGLLKPGGRYLMCENSLDGLGQLNLLRTACGLDPIAPPWHNTYLADAQVAALDIPRIRLVAVEAYSATYYFLSRVVNAWLAKRENRKPSYDAPVNQLSLHLPPFGDCAQGKLWIFEKDPD